MKQKKHSGLIPWKPGQSGNPAGRPIGARARISEKLLADLATVWEAHGESVLTRLATEEPGKLAQIAYGLLPRDVFISVEQRAPGNLEPDEWATLRRVLDVIEQCAPAGSDPSKVFETIEQALRAEHATLIESRADAVSA
jgi:Family of unknown function (DUF5681)